MIRLRAFSLVPVAIALLTSNSWAADCTVYQHRDYGGASWSLDHGSYLVGVDAGNFGNSGGEPVDYRPDWNDVISSFRLAPGCMLRTYEHFQSFPSNGGGMSRDWSTSVKYVGGKWNDKITVARCICGE